MAGEQVLPGADGIQCQPGGYPPPAFAQGQVLPKHDEIVAEVEVCLARVALREGATAHVAYDRGGAGVDAIAGALESPTEVDLFLVGEKVRVEASMGEEDGGTHEHGRPRGPEDGCGVVVLSGVALAGVEHATAGEGVPEAVDPAAGGAGVFEAVGCVPVEDLGLAGGDAFVTGHQRHHWLYPAGLDLDVRIQQHADLGTHLRQGRVIALGEPFIGGVCQDADGRVLRAEEVERPVGRPVVGHHHLESRVGGP